MRESYSLILRESHLTFHTLGLAVVDISVFPSLTRVDCEYLVSTNLTFELECFYTNDQCFYFGWHNLEQTCSLFLKQLLLSIF